MHNNTDVYCGHENTTKKKKFVNHIDPNNQLLKEAIIEIKNKRKKGLPTVPFELGKEKTINPFLRADDHNFTNSIGLKTSDPNETFSAIRLKKDNF